MALESKDLMEISFSIFYLIIIWVFDIIMFRNRKNLVEETKRETMLFFYAFVLLAIGDTGHVGFRVLAFAMGGLEDNAFMVAVGRLSTAITITLFYMFFIEIWRIHFKRRGLMFQ